MDRKPEDVIGEEGGPFVWMDPFVGCCSVTTLEKTNGGVEKEGTAPYMCSVCGKGWFKMGSGRFFGARAFVEAIPGSFTYRNGKLVRKIGDL